MNRKIVCHTLGTKFREVTRIEKGEIPKPKPHQVLVKNLYAGINASDINFTAGKYVTAPPPLDCGFEGIGEVVDTGAQITDIKKGQFVVFMSNGAFSEYQVVDRRVCFVIPRPQREFLPLLVSGLTASIGLKEVGELRSGETVLVTAAAGGTGVFAVQLAKLAGNHVVGTCSSADKVKELQALGCDRVINYKTEDLNAVLRKEYPKGVDVVYESVGGETFDICVKNLAIKGRLIIIGLLSGYSDGKAWEGAARLDVAPALLKKSASVRGFFLNHYSKLLPEHLTTLTKLWSDGKLKVVVDKQRFEGLEAVPDAIEHMYKGKNVGKVIVTIQNPASKL